MSFAGRAENSSGCVTTPKEREIGLSGFAAQIRLSSLTGSYGMATVEHREPCESRGSRTVLGAPGGETPPGDSPNATGNKVLILCRYRGTPDMGGRVTSLGPGANDPTATSERAVPC